MELFTLTSQAQTDQSGCLEFNDHTALTQAEIYEKYIKTDEGSKDILLKKDKIKEQIEAAFKTKDKWPLIEIRKVVDFGNISDRSVQSHLGRCGCKTIKDDYRWVWVKK